MKGLLHSKRFRTNLYKWLFMYTGVMLLFTTVITYSKYMTRMYSNGEAVPAKFNVNIHCTEGIANNACGTTETKFRRTSKIEYSFTVDTRELEVEASFFMTITVDPRFKVESLTKGSSTTNLYKGANANGTFTTDEQIFNRSGKIENYKLVVSYNGPENVTLPDTQIIKIDYTAVQQKK